MDIEYVDAKFHYVSIDELECGDVFVFKDHDLKDPCVYFDKRDHKYWFIATGGDQFPDFVSGSDYEVRKLNARLVVEI